MERGFEKISFEEFSKDICNDKDLYESYLLPSRQTSFSAGYDFYAVKDMVIKPGEILKIPTGYKVKMQDNEALLIIVRSSMGFKYNIRMCNQVGLIDKDYYNNPTNEGHMYVALQNEGDKEFVINKKDAYAQGIFINYLTCSDNVKKTRNSGIGSTNRKDENYE